MPKEKELTPEQLEIARGKLLAEQRQEEARMKECMNKIEALLKEYGFKLVVQQAEAMIMLTK